MIAPRKGIALSIWKQLLGIAVAICVVGFVVVRYLPGGRAYLADLGLIPGATVDAAGGSGAAPGGRSDGASGPSGAGRQNMRSALVVVSETTEVTINDRVMALGTGAAVQSATLTPSSSGLLTEVRVKSGVEVDAREVVATLDPASEQVAYDTARVAYDDARKTLDRFKKLESSSSVSATQLQTYQFAADKAELAVRQAKIDLDNRQVVSPIAGTLGIIQVNPGVEVTQSTVIATVEDNSAIKVSFDLPERFVGKVNPGDAVLAVPIARPGNELRAVVTALDNRIDETSGSFEIEARIPNGDHTLRSGMSFTMTMSFAGDTYLAVPPLAVQWGSDGAYVWRVTDEVAERVAVSLVQRNAENVLVSGNLALGDRVVTEGLENLREGMTVRVGGKASADLPPETPATTQSSISQTVGAAEASPLPSTSPTSSPAPSGN